MIGRTNAGGGGLNKSVIVVTAPTGSTVTCAMGTTTKTAPEKNGTWTFSGINNGTWVITATLNGKTATKSVIISRLTVEYVTIAYSQIPEFSYTGEYEIVDDDGNPITTSQGNWKIRFLTSGTFTLTSLNGAENGIDVFMVGGGGAGGMQRAGGGAGGYTKTVKNLVVTAGVNYAITIGAGGEVSINVNENGGSGGTTSAFGNSVDGGEGGYSYGNGRTGGNGGSGGGGGEQTGKGGSGGIDGSDGMKGNYAGGKGQGTTTREFAEASGKLYSTGGDGAGNDGANKEQAGTANTGDGGSSSNIGSYPGGSGIVIIRNHREEAA